MQLSEYVALSPPLPGVVVTWIVTGFGYSSGLSVASAEVVAGFVLVSVAS